MTMRLTDHGEPNRWPKRKPILLSGFSRMATSFPAATIEICAASQAGKPTMSVVRDWCVGKKLPYTMVAALLALWSTSTQSLTPQERQTIAEEAFIYGFPMVMNYAVFYQFFVDRSSPEYKAPLNQLPSNG